MPDAAPTSPPAPAAVDASTILAADWPARTLGPLTGERGGEYQAIIRKSVIDKVHEHGQSITSVEICGVLVGNVFHDDNGPYLLISGSIPGDRASSHAAQVTFTAETWTAIQAVMDRDYPDERIVGWYHTHPGFGIFLSGMDLFIQDNFFNLPWQVAWVYDPKSGDEGMFYWKDGKTDRRAYLVEADPESVENTDRQSLFAPRDEQQSETPAEPPANPQPEAPVEPAAAVAAQQPVYLEPAYEFPRDAFDPSQNKWSRGNALKRGPLIPTWVIGTIAFIVAFGATLWAMYSMQDKEVVNPLHSPHPTQNQTMPSPAPHGTATVNEPSASASYLLGGRTNAR